ncbi:MAG TPA: Fe-Mn family superoxide dismutase [Candidatus Obscuribacterales bacterium]
MTAKLTRRELLGAAALAGGGLLAANGLLAADEHRSRAAAEAASGPPTAYRGRFEVKPLPFKPDKLRGISQRLILSHHQNNYGGAVKRLNEIQKQLGLLPADAPAYLMGALKREEARAMNSMILHELYFAALGGSGGSPAGKIGQLIKQSYGSSERWQHDFKLTGQSLSGGSGWVVLAWCPRDRQVLNIWSSDHLVNLAWGVPLLVMDMYEHSYQLDYGADARAYIEAFFNNIDWQEVDGRCHHL